MGGNAGKRHSRLVCILSGAWRHVKDSRKAVHFILDRMAGSGYPGILSAKNISSWEWTAPQSCRRPVHFFVMSIIARYSIFSRLSSVGNTDLAFVTFRSCRLKFSMALVV